MIGSKKLKNVILLSTDKNYSGTLLCVRNRGKKIKTIIVYKGSIGSNNSNLFPHYVKQVQQTDRLPK